LKFRGRAASVGMCFLALYCDMSVPRQDGGGREGGVFGQFHCKCLKTMQLLKFRVFSRILALFSASVGGFAVRFSFATGQ
jgi:hypothetical protein